MLGFLFSSPAPIVSLILTIAAPEFALSQALETTTFHAVHRLHSCNFVAKVYIIPTTDVQLATILKRSCQKKERNFINICWNCWELNSQLIKNFFIVPTIGLLLEITAQRCTLHTFSSTVEIFENSFGSYRTLFSRIHKYLAKKYP